MKELLLKNVNWRLWQVKVINQGKGRPPGSSIPSLHEIDSQIAKGNMHTRHHCICRISTSHLKPGVQAWKVGYFWRQLAIASWCGLLVCDCHQLRPVWGHCICEPLFYTRQPAGLSPSRAFVSVVDFGEVSAESWTTQGQWHHLHWHFGVARFCPVLFGAPFFMPSEWKTCHHPLVPDLLYALLPCLNYC